MAIIKLLRKEEIANNVFRFVFEKPENFNIGVGQAVSLGLNGEFKPYTPVNFDGELEFIIKIYYTKGFTEDLIKLFEGAEVFISEPFSAVSDFGRGVFIAAGSGITPFLAMIRKGECDLLFYSNKTKAEIILEEDLRKWLGSKVMFNLTKEYLAGYERGRIDKDYLEEHLKDYKGKVFVCGPDGFVSAVVSGLKEIGIEQVYAF